MISGDNHFWIPRASTSKADAKIKIHDRYEKPIEGNDY